MGEEIERSVYRGEWASETSNWMGWSPETKGKQISGDSTAFCSDSLMFNTISEPKQSHFLDFGVQSSIWGQDLLSTRNDLSYDNRLMAPSVMNTLKQENPCLNLDSQAFVCDSSMLTRKLQETLPVFPPMAGEVAIMGEKSLVMDHGHALSVYSDKVPSLSTTAIPQSSGSSSLQKGLESNVALKDSFIGMKKNEDTASKRPRSDTHAPFTTFKVRKEKLGDRITALQQLVSPFGKTDTASVLFDAIEYIKFLHDQVTVLCTPYMTLKKELTGVSMDKDEPEKEGLRIRGLCLVPISTSLSVAKHSSTDFWAPTFGGSYR